MISEDSGRRIARTIARKVRKSLRVALCALLLPPFAAEAQQLDSLRLGILTRAVGSEVRLSTPSSGRIQGRLLEVRSEGLRIDESAGPRTVLFSSRDTLWVGEPLGWTAAKFGAAAGLAGAAGVLLFFRSMCGAGDDPCTGFGRGALILGGGGIVFGAGAGLVAGQLINHWVRKTP